MQKESLFGKDYLPFNIGKITYIAKKDPILLSANIALSNIPIAYQTYGKLNQTKTNAILLCHPLTGDQYAASKHPVTGKEGWWQHLIGPNKVIDTNKYFVICPNNLGSCMGTIGPKELNPNTKKPYNLDFPIITISDMVNVQKRFLEEIFSIKTLHAVIGGSMGGMLVLEWAAKHPEMLKSAIAIATAARHTAQNIAFHEVGRQAIMADQKWHQGNYIEKHSFPAKGLAVARMAAHVTYLSEAALAEKFGRNLQDKGKPSYKFEIDFQIESYLHHQGITFVDRFDANSYLFITRAMDYFDLENEYNGQLAKAFTNSTQVKFCLISFSDDWLFPTSEIKLILNALNFIGAEVSFAEIESNRGHDSFLIENQSFSNILQGFLEGLE
ncbi:MAG: homoserine O-acetyltransferase MetX [Rickettsiales bacterium]